MGVLVAALAAAVALAGCGGGSSRGPARSATGPSAPGPANTVPESAPGTLRISPSHPTTRSSVAFEFTAPTSEGVRGGSEIVDSLSVTGPDGPRCVGAHEAAAPRVRAHASATITLDPAGLGGPWCPGAWTARVIELQRAHCSAGVPCPQDIRVVAIVARGTFDVARTGLRR